MIEAFDIGLAEDFRGTDGTLNVRGNPMRRHRLGEDDDTLGDYKIAASVILFLKIRQGYTHEDSQEGCRRRKRCIYQRVLEQPHPS